MGGDRIRIFNACKTLAGHYSVDLAVISEGEMERNAITELEKLGLTVIPFAFPSWRFKLNALSSLLSSQPLQVGYYYFSEIQKWVHQHIAEYDVVLCNHIRSAEYFRFAPVKKIIDLHDAISLNYSRAGVFAKGIWKYIYTIENRRILPYEVATVKNFDCSFIVSHIDKDFLVKNGADGEKIRILPVAVSDSLFSGSEPDDEQDWIVFVGKMDTVANSDAAVYFTRSIFPQIRSELPAVQLYIVGADPSPAVQLLGSMPGVHVTGKVADHLEFVKKAKVVIDPMRFGAGMQNKVLEAMALAKPVVATTLATEAIGGRHEREYLVADSVNDTVRSCIFLLKNAESRRTIGLAAQSFIKERYTWNVVGQSLLNIVHEVCK